MVISISGPNIRKQLAGSGKPLTCAGPGDLIGERILDTDFSCTLQVYEGAGAFVCGEETALINSIEGDRGFPRIRPPYPVEEGIVGPADPGKQYGNICSDTLYPRNGADKFSVIGTETSKGTKVFSLTGKIVQGGLIEVPMGTTIRQIVEEIGGGIPMGRKFKAVQIGGPFRWAACRPALPIFPSIMNHSEKPVA